MFALFSQKSHMMDCEYQASSSSSALSVGGCAKYCNLTQTVGTMGGPYAAQEKASAGQIYSLYL